METLARISRYFRPYLPAVVLSLTLSILVSFTEAGMAVFVKPIFDEVFFGKNRAFLKWIPIALLTLVILKGTLGYLQNYLMSRVCMRVVVKLRSELYEHYLRLSMSQFDHTPTGYLMSRITADVGGLQQTVPIIISLVRQAFTLMALASVALYRDWQLTLLGLSVVPFTGIPIYFIGETLKRNQRRTLSSMGNLNTIAYEAFSGIRIIKVFGAELREAERFRRENDNLLKIVIKNTLVGLSASPLTEVITALGVSAVFLIGGLHAIKGEVTPGEFFSFVAAVLLMYRPVRRISEINKTLQNLVASGERMFQLLDEVPDVVDRPGATELKTLEEEITFDHVWFRYPPPQRRALGEDGMEVVQTGVKQDWVIKDVSFKIRKGETVALVGSSGAGKTTLASFLPRFYDITQGALSIDGTDIRDVTMESLRSQIALVTQETYLFNETVGNNIAYGLKRQVSQAEIENAARAANAHDFITELPDGYNSIIGERGVKLSGGQRQRLAIARALLRNAPILILDEATSSLDTESEQEVQKALDLLMHDRTTLVIAHRLSTVRNASRIVVIENGEKVEEGTHEELIEKGGAYKYLYELQYFGESDKAACG